MRLGWIGSVVFALGAGWTAAVGEALPYYLLLAYALAVLLLGRPLERRIQLATGVEDASMLWMLVAAVFGGVVALIAEILAGFTIDAFLLNWALLAAMAIVAVWTASGDFTYESVGTDFRFGLVSMIFVLAVAHLVAGHRILLTGGVYLATILYALLGMLALTFSRRFALDEIRQDERAPAFDRDWVLATLVILAAIALVSIVLIQLFAFDIVGGLGAFLQPILIPFGAVLGTLRAVLLATLTWLLHFLPPIHGHLKLRPNPYNRPTRPSSGHSHHFVAGHPAAWVITLVKAVGVLVAGGVALALVAAAFGALRRARRSQMVTERRISSWTWRKMARWMLRRSGDELGNLRPRLGHLPHSHRLRSVRDVYRAYLRFAAKRMRSRARSETGLEYSHHVELLWRETTVPLDELNRLYMAERYGSALATREAVGAAKRDLQAVEAGIRAHEAASDGGGDRADG